jgi:hypothetical protein
MMVNKFSFHFPRLRIPLMGHSQVLKVNKKDYKTVLDDRDAEISSSCG